MKCSAIQLTILFLVITIISGCASNNKNYAPQLANGSYNEVLSRMQAGIGDQKANKKYQLDKERMVIYGNKDKNNKRQYKPKMNCLTSDNKLDLSGISNVTLNLIESDLREALIEVSMLTDIPIVMDESVEGIVTANINDKSLEIALDMMLSIGNYAYKVKENYILVGSAQADNPTISQLSDTCIYKPENLKPIEIVELLSLYYRQYVTFSKKSRYLTITAPKNIQKKLSADILKLDFPPEQVLLEVSIIEISSDALRVMGIDWGQLMFVDQRNINATNIGITNSGIDQTVDFSSYMNASNPYITFLSAVKFLSDKGMAMVKGMPSIVTLDGHIANFNSTQTIWFTPDRNYSQNTKTVELTYGINLEIIPKLAHNNMVKLDIIKAGVSDLTHSSRGTSPKVISHTISNTIRVGNGETLVMGGLLQKKNYVKNSQIPGLGDIPVAGYLFKQDGEGSYTTEVMIVITPRILKTNEQLT
ncbi:hypothetical protein L3V82_09070 [Thiotrichales bacterium 19S3-7]|nr:hypothetical protein [Thiotrichales bacterium 19S3-7]MCF6802310.1 hypothetical protein [Thiotrichales bacterium 19S3-11]